MTRHRLASSVAVLAAALGSTQACGGSDDSGLGTGKGGSGPGGAAGGGSGGGGTGGASGDGGGAGGTAGTGATGGVAESGATGGAAGDAGTDASCPDADGDKVTTCAGDCDDTDATSYPGATEICGDGADNDCDTQSDEGCGGIGTWVSASIGNDGNPGTQAQPVKTIAKGLSNAATLKSGGATNVAIYVGEGTYTEKVKLSEDIDLLGGYQCGTASCTWARDPKTHISEIVATDPEGLAADVTITRVTLVEGLTLRGQNGGGAGTGRYAVSLLGGSPTLMGNKVVGPNVNSGNFQSGRSIGIGVIGASGMSNKGPLVDGNEIAAGQAVETAIGVLFEGQSATPAFAEIVRNKITGGTGKSSNGVAAWASGAGTLLENNEIQAGTASTGSAFAIAVGGKLDVNANRLNIGTGGSCAAGNVNYCGGIGAFSATATITNNVIAGVNAERSVGVMLMEAEVPAGVVILNANTIDGAGPANSVSSSRSAAVVVRIGTCNTCGFKGINGRIRNNVLLGGKAATRFGLYEDAPAPKQAHPEALMNNVFWNAAPAGANDALYRVFDGSNGTNLTTIAAVNGLTQIPSASSNLSVDPKVGNNWHLLPASPCINAGVINEAPPKDMDFENRPKGSAIDIGADEAG